MQLHSADISRMDFQIKCNICQNTNENGTTEAFRHITIDNVLTVKKKTADLIIFYVQGSNKAR